MRRQGKMREHGIQREWVDLGRKQKSLENLLCEKYEKPSQWELREYK